MRIRTWHQLAEQWVHLGEVPHQFKYTKQIGIPSRLRLYLCARYQPNVNFSTFWHIWLLPQRFRPGLVSSSTKTLLTTFNPLELRLLRFSHPGCHYHDHTRRSAIQRRGVIRTNAIHCLDFGLFVTFSVFAHVPMGETQSEVAGGSDEKN